MHDGQVLVVEDDPEVNELVGAYAQIAGFIYEPALNGSIALEKAAHHVPALILLDVMLPDLDGFEVCRRLKSEDRTRGVPVIMLTALDRDEYRLRGQQCGAVAYVTKPFDPDHLVEVIRSNARNGDGET
jgi:DNA-binding response OmpR family regulator